MTERITRWLAGGVTLAIACLLGSSAAQAEIRLPKMLSSHAVLQRERPIHVWGWSEPGECVHITFHGQAVQACASQLGMWSTYLQAEAAGGPYSLVVTGSDNTRLTVEDLLVGDVWFASGQSNMEMPLKGFGADTPIKDGAKEIAAANHPRIRLLRFEKSATAYPLNDVSATWTECTPQNAADFSAVAYFFGRELADKEKVPIGLIDSTWGGTPIESWISLDAIGHDSALMPLFISRARFVANRAEIPELLAAEKREDAEAATQGRPAPKHPWHPGEEGSWNPSYLYNGMIAPATGYTIRGFLWYQGETNSDPERAPLYKREMPALIADWRARWGEGNLPFFLVQLSSFDSPREVWGEIREAQRESLAVTNTGVAVSYDVGTPKNVHPPDKQTVGHRLALGARALSYAEKLDWSGPAMQSADLSGKTVRVTFDHAEGLHAGSGEIKGFELGDKNGVFSPATARIDGQSVLVESSGVTEPAAIRYGYANVTDANLYNRADLPALAFEQKF